MIFKNKAFKICTIILSVIIVLSILFCVAISLPVVKYNYAIGLIEDGDYQKAYEILYPLGDYEDNIEIMKDFTHNYTLETITDSKGEKEERTYDYDAKGNLKAKSYYSFDDSKYECEYVYDSNNRLVKDVVVHIYPSSEKYTTITRYEYNENGYLVKEIDDMSGFFTAYEYDEKGNFLRRVNYKGDADCECIYDEKGNLIQEKHYLEFGDEVTSQYDYTYDASDNLIKIVKKESSLENSSVLEGVYNSKGNLIKIMSYTTGEGYEEYKDIVEIEYNTDGSINKVTNNVYTNRDLYNVKRMQYSSDYYFIMSKIHPGYIGNESDTWFTTLPNSTQEYTYDENGNEIKVVATDKNGKVQTTESSYNENGKLIKSTITYIDGTSRTNEYKYDAYGNILEKKLFDDSGKVLEIKEYSNYVGSYNK